MFADGGDASQNFAVAFQQETGAIDELIGAKKYDDACRKADEIAAKYKIDLTKEQQGLVTAEKLAADGGKGTGTCSVADAAKMQMEIHGLLQADVQAGKRTPAIFETFNYDTRGYGEMLVTDPSKACALFDGLRKKYGLPAAVPAQAGAPAAGAM